MREEGFGPTDYLLLLEARCWNMVYYDGVIIIHQRLRNTDGRWTFWCFMGDGGVNIFIGYRISARWGTFYGILLSPAI